MTQLSGAQMVEAVASAYFFNFAATTKSRN